MCRVDVRDGKQPPPEICGTVSCDSSTAKPTCTIANDFTVVGCANTHPELNLAHRAYIVSKQSDELHVIDLDRLEIIGVVAIRGIWNHMAEVSRDLARRADGQIADRGQSLAKCRPSSAVTLRFKSLRTPGVRHH